MHTRLVREDRTPHSDDGAGPLRRSCRPWRAVPPVALADTDGGGASDGDEIAAGTDPTDPTDD